MGDAVNSGTATLSLTGAGSRVYVGGAAVAQGSLLPIGQTALIVSGTSGISQLAVYNGNQVQNSGSGYLGVGTAETGAAIVSGATSAWHNSGDVFVGMDGTATLSLVGGGTVSAGGQVTVGAHGTLQGNGTVTGGTLNSGAVSPGLSVGSLAVNGNYSQSSSGHLQIELGGSTAGTYDTLNVTGEGTLDGGLTVTLVNPFVPLLGDQFDFLTATAGVGGSFATAQLPTLAPGKMWHIRYTANTATTARLVVGLAGDYNDDGVVDGADYTVWRDLLGAALDPRADGDTNGVVDIDDYNVWKANFGLSAGAGASTGGDQGIALGTSGVPEPGAVTLFCGVFLLLSTSLRLSARRV